MEPFTVIQGPSAWVGSEIQKDSESYIYHVTESDIKELDAAIAAVEASGVKTAEQVRCRLRKSVLQNLLDGIQQSFCACLCLHQHTRQGAVVCTFSV